MKNSRDKEPRYLEKNEYLTAKEREEELYKLLDPWFDDVHPKHLKANAPEGYEKLLKEFREATQNVYYTEFMNGVAY